MNIGIFTDTYEPQINGVVTSIKAAIDYLQPHHKVWVFCPNVRPPQASTDHIWRFPSVVYPFQKEYRLVWPYNKRIKDMAKLDLDIIHIHTPFTMGYIGLRVAKQLSLPVIHTYHTYFEKYIHYVPLLPKKFVAKYARRESESFCNQCDRIIVPTDEMHRQLSQYNITTPIQVLPSGVHHITPSTSDISAFKATHMCETAFNALFVGRVGKEKNIHFLLDAIHAVINQGHDIHCTIIGDGPEMAAVQKRIMADQLSDRITLTGYLSKHDVYCAYYAADALVFPSKTETQGLTAVESLMCGTPVIGLNEMGIKNVVDHNVSGLLTSDDVGEYQSAIIEMIT
ncbi:MAG: glycosyltransferase, partial [Candidatus Marinamargulisbacteria bacterium]